MTLAPLNDVSHVIVLGVVSIRKNIHCTNFLIERKLKTACTGQAGLVPFKAPQTRPAVWGLQHQHHLSNLCLVQLQAVSLAKIHTALVRQGFLVIAKKTLCAHMQLSTE